MKKLIALLLALVMVLGLVACGSKSDDTAKDDAAREAALEKVAEVCSYFDVMRSNLESVYSETRFMEQPEGFISDLNHHNHLASKTNNSDWWYYYEIPMVKKVRAWMK